MSNIRTMKDKKPFSWQEKEVIRQIHILYDGRDKELTSAMSLYLTLTFVASNKGDDSFEATRGALRGYSGLSFPTIDKRLDEFEKEGYIKVERGRWEKGTKKRLPLKITLLTLPPK